MHNHSHWAPVTTLRLVGFGVGMGVLLWLILGSQSGFVFGVDHANLVIHEAAHTFFGAFSDRLEIYGGTLGQLLAPLVMVGFFAWRGDPLGTAGMGVWFFENWLNIARYMADARALVLPLVGGSQHDWNTILDQWNVLAYDTRIAGVLVMVGLIGMAAPCVWLIWRWHLHQYDDENQLEA